MAFGLFNTNRDALPATEPGERIYAIGDVHGHFDLLRDLLDRLEAHSNALPAARSIHVVLLGDLIDRGPDSARIIQFLYNSQQNAGRLIVLLGNHEELMLRTLDGEPGMLRAWMRAGGDATLKSFDIELPPADADPAEFAAHMASKIPAAWIEWLRKLPLTARSGDYQFCHAGIRPGVPMKRQTRADLLWIRDEFLMDDVTDHGAVVVHGHSVATEVEVRPHRIGIDTGAYRTGVLTALYLERGEREIISTRGAVAMPSMRVAGRSVA